MKVKSMFIPKLIRRRHAMAGHELQSRGKNLVLIALLSTAILPVPVVCSQPTTIETVKKSRGFGKWLGTIVPCILSLISAEVAIRQNKDNPDRKEVVFAAKFMRMLTAVIGCFFLDDWISTDFKEWSLGSSNIK